MNKEIIAINQSAELNDYFITSFASEQRLVIRCNSLTEARRHMRSETFALIIYSVPVSSPQEAQEAVSSLRQLSYAPMLVLAPDNAVERLLGAGADCCLHLETSSERTVAYARALIRRYTLYNHYDIAEPDASVLYRGDLMIDPLRHRATLAGEEINLQRREFRLLLYFAQNPGIVLTADQICENVWGTEYNYRVAPVIAKLRAKLGDNGRNPVYIETVYGTGYRFLPNK